MQTNTNDFDSMVKMFMLPPDKGGSGMTAEQATAAASKAMEKHREKSLSKKS